MSSTSIADEGYDDLEDDGGLSGFWILSIFLIVLSVFSAIVYFAYQRGLADRSAGADLPIVSANSEPVREEIELTPADTTRDTVMQELNSTDTSRVVADIDPQEDPLTGYDDDPVSSSSDTSMDLGGDEPTDPFPQTAVLDDPVVDTPPVPTVAPREERPTTTTRPQPQQTTTTPAAGAAGTWAVQIGAFGSNDEAMNNYNRLSGRYGTLISGQTPEVNVAVVNGVTYHRLWVGEFGSRDAAQSHCNSLKAAGQDCLARQR